MLAASYLPRVVAHVLPMPMLAARVSCATLSRASCATRSRASRAARYGCSRASRDFRVPFSCLLCCPFRASGAARAAHSRISRASCAAHTVLPPHVSRAPRAARSRSARATRTMLPPRVVPLSYRAARVLPMPPVLPVSYSNPTPCTICLPCQSYIAHVVVLPVFYLCATRALPVVCLI
ncbi:unnamed protein product [Closterium sp. NIES-54]